MASQPPANLPLFYNDLIPLSSVDHVEYKSRATDRAPFFAKAHAIPLTVDEFVMAQRFYPIVFSAGPNPVPLGLFPPDLNVTGAVGQGAVMLALFTLFP